jgi:hypothetical protein
VSIPIDGDEKDVYLLTISLLHTRQASSAVSFGKQLRATWYDLSMDMGVKEDAASG